MRRKITVFIIIGVCYLLQTTFFDTLSFASISPNLLIIVTSSFGFMRGRKEGLFIGFFCGLLLDIFGGGVLGFYSLLYMYIGYINGMFRKLFYPEDIKLPLVLIAGSDLSCNLLIYFIMFLFRNRYDFNYYFLQLMIPELVYTMVITIFLYFIIHSAKLIIPYGIRSGLSTPSDIIERFVRFVMFYLPTGNEIIMYQNIFFQIL